MRQQAIMQIYNVWV